MSEILIWDCADPVPIRNQTIVSWSGDSSHSVSVLELVEASSQSIKQRYLAWIYALGRASFRGRTVIDRLELRSGVSYWWMTRLFEKCNFEKSTFIDDAVKLIAFSDWSRKRRFESVRLVSSHRALAECMRQWCAWRKVKFIWEQKPASKCLARSCFRRCFDRLPMMLKGVSWLLRYLMCRWPLRGIGVSAWKNSAGRLCFFTYLFNISLTELKAGNYRSQYWGPLPDALKKAGCRTNWLHIYIEDGLLSDARTAASALHSFNLNSSNGEIHTTLDSFLNCAVLLGTLRDWARVGWRARKIERVLQETTPDAGVFIWPLFKAEWREVTAGITSVSNLLLLNQLQVALASLPTQQMGVYLQENQGWEFGLLQAWKNAKHGKIVGCPHSTVRYWDLRYFFDPREYSCTKATPMPRPGLVAINGAAAREAYLEGGYPVNELTNVEALRYLHLAEGAYQSSPKIAGSKLRLLVLSDYAIRHTCTQLRLLTKASKILGVEHLDIIIKPHPACPVDPADFPDLAMTFTMSPIETLLEDCDVAFVSAMTSAAIDAYCAGISVIAVRDNISLNLSPLRSCPDVCFITTPDDLATALQSFFSEKELQKDRPPIFYLDSSLPRWRSLLLGRQAVQQ